ncbi:hypothetical protein AB9P05_24445 [Roseivirga sp. BDSF3-8]|uniref:hypothetical protein n=1 Tax=Roseivirga sp. BDSF3-8 TaxID=3241598 RepID=UPI00353255BC
MPCFTPAFGSTPDIITPDTFLGITLGNTSLEVADSILLAYSYKEPLNTFRYFTYSSGAERTFHYRLFYIKVRKAKIRVLLAGRDKVGAINLYFLKPGTIKLYNITPGKTRVRILSSPVAIESYLQGSPQVVFNNLMDDSISVELSYRDIRIKRPVKSESAPEEEWRNKKIKEIVLLKSL